MRADAEIKQDSVRTVDSAGIEQFGKLKKIAANSREIRKNRKPCGGFGDSFAVAVNAEQSAVGRE